jgi:hypothetical protein
MSFVPDATKVSSWFFPPWSSGVEDAVAAPTSVASAAKADKSKIAATAAKGMNMTKRPKRAAGFSVDLLAPPLLRGAGIEK